LIDQSLDNINWVGFYFLEDDPLGGDGPVLLVGPFQGKPACVRIEIGQGVCGTAVATGETQRVADVHAFEGHIACDPQSRSEIVIPVRHRGEIIGVLDIDSPDPDRFDATDQAGLEHLAECYSASLG
jgi:GAF domain-containing protein